VDYFIQRIEQKNWRYLWPKLDLITSASEAHSQSERTIHIRLLKGSDVEAFAELRLEGLRLYPEYFGESLEEAHKSPMEKMRAKLTSTSDRFVLGAWSEKNELVGMIGFYRESGAKFRHKGVLWGMYVTPSHQGLGIGKALLQAAIAQVNKIQGVEKVQLSVVTSNLPAKRLYQQYGFEGYGLEKNAFKWNDQYWDEELMFLQISS
jgi:ribosomal protein S18 acetylase RimI-like enzyme